MISLLFGLSVAFGNDLHLADLHNHTFMNQGLSPVFSGDFFEPIAATSWNSFYKSRVNAQTLNDSPFDFVVVSLYAHPIFKWNQKESIRSQIAMAKKFVMAHSDWVIVRDPMTLEAALASKKRALIFSLEGASGILESEEDLAEFVDKEGISIVSIAHLNSDHFGGAALLEFPKYLITPLTLIKSLFSGSRNSEGVLVNNSGFSKSGSELMASLIKRHVWLDLAHSTDIMAMEILESYQKLGLPPIVTHTLLRRFLKAERLLPDWIIKKVKEMNGIVGLMLTEEELPRIKSEHCKDSIDSLLSQYEILGDEIGNEKILFGTDLNGTLNTLSNSCELEQLPKEGLVNVSQLTDFWNEMKKRSTKIPNDQSSAIKHFIEAWKKIKN